MPARGVRLSKLRVLGSNWGCRYQDSRLVTGVPCALRLIQVEGANDITAAKASIKDSWVSQVGAVERDRGNAGQLRIRQPHAAHDPMVAFAALFLKLTPGLRLLATTPLSQ